ncbi:MAG: GntR family transcriptional regulator [Rhodospirillales bacterium]|nr:GntR family transcriptional regulator [Rhodospirillales bacterium]
MTADRPARGLAVLGTLRRRIVLNELAPGALLTELALAVDLGCSQAAVREALLRLDGEGLVCRAGRAGTTVTDLDAATAGEILDLRRRMELRAARHAVRRATGGDVARLASLQEAMDRAAETGDAWALIERDTEFHLALYRIGGVPALAPILARCIMHTHRFKLWAPWHRRPLAVTAARHRPILAAVRAGNGAGLVRALGDHLDSIVERKEAVA